MLAVSGLQFAVRVIAGDDQSPDCELRRMPTSDRIERSARCNFTILGAVVSRWPHVVCGSYTLPRYRPAACFALPACSLHFQNLRKFRQYSEAVFGNHSVIFVPDAADTREIETGLDREYLPFFELGGGDPR